MAPKKHFGLLKETFKEWGEDKAARLGAALAYYTIFSIGPLLLVLISIAGLALGQEAAQGRIVETLRGGINEDGAKVIQELILSASKPTSSIIATGIGLATLLLGAAGIFGQLKDALNTIWGVMPRKGVGIVEMLKDRIAPFVMVLGASLLLLVLLAANATLAALGDILGSVLPGGALLWQAVNYAISFGTVTLVFAMFFKVLPDARIVWSNVWLGAIITALLFILGQFGLAFYLSVADVGSAFGAAGSLVVILVWIYYSAQILFFGAEFTQVYANTYGTPVAPEWQAEVISDKERAEQGLKPGKVAKQRARQEGGKRASPWFK
jgi:membrane protein